MKPHDRKPHERDPLDRFAELVRSGGNDVPLDQASLLIAEALDSTLPMNEGLSALDNLSSRAGATTAIEVVRFLRDDLGLSGDASDYYNPLNSLLPRVLERRRGIPISLSIIAIEIGRRSGVPLVGVGMPGHFLIGAGARGDAAGDPGPARYYDPFNSSEELDIDGCKQIFFSIGGRPEQFHPGLLAPVPNLGIVTRVLNNLKAIYTNTGEVASLRIVTDLRHELPTVDAADRAALAVALASRGRFDEAAREFEALAEQAGDEGGDEFARRAEQLWARLN